jgi:anthranilate synthase component 1
MRIEPDFAAFAAAYDAGRAQVVWVTLAADLETPVSVMLKLAEGRPFSFLLESVEGGAIRGRYSIIGLNPDAIWRCFGNKPEIAREFGRGPPRFEASNQASLASLRALLAESRIELPDGLPPMAAGIVGYLGYDMVRLIERLPDTKPDPLGLPDALLVRPTVMAIFDNVRDQLTVVTPVRANPALDAKTAYARAEERLGTVVDDIDRALPHRPEPTPGSKPEGLLEPVSNTDLEDYLALVRRAKDYIAAGDIFQVVLSQRFSVPFTLPPFALYRALRRTNPSPFLFFLDFRDFAVVGSSPEILVRLRDGKVTIRPIAGTRPRGATAVEDRALEQELLNDPKERAEHLMLLDLGRNDVGRVARTGTVKVTDQMVIERYSHVMHIVSNVEGEADPAFDALDVLFAGFPAGTVSGAPKVRAMEIIEELETARRGIYGGGVGYFAANGAMDTCIALRTALVKDRIMYVQAGGGIVYDSKPLAEYRESVNKARALIRAAEEAIGFAQTARRKR